VKSRRLRRDFYDRATLTVARDLIGKVLVHQTPEGRTAGVIVETEAYIGEEDPACHAAPGPTRRNRPLYGPPGFSYVYLNYGIHFLMNVVTESEGAPAAVLLRALEPVDGIALMRQRRGSVSADPRRVAAQDLCRGPGNLSKALGISLLENRLDLEGDRLFLEDRGHVPGEIAWGPRVGIRVGTEHEWRCFVVGSRAVSGRRGGG
jgi:DNA-3-methyladenine glycosylase